MHQATGVPIALMPHAADSRATGQMNVKPNGLFDEGACPTDWTACALGRVFRNVGTDLTLKGSCGADLMTEHSRDAVVNGIV